MGVFFPLLNVSLWVRCLSLFWHFMPQKSTWASDFESLGFVGKRRIASILLSGRAGRGTVIRWVPRARWKCLEGWIWLTGCILPTSGLVHLVSLPPRLWVPVLHVSICVSVRELKTHDEHHHPFHVNAYLWNTLAKCVLSEAHRVCTLGCWRIVWQVGRGLESLAAQCGAEAGHCCERRCHHQQAG